MKPCVFFRIGNKIINSNCIKSIKYSWLSKPQFKSGWMCSYFIEFYDDIDISSKQYYCDFRELDKVFWEWGNGVNRLFRLDDMDLEEAIKYDQREYEITQKELEKMMEDGVCSKTTHGR